MIGAIQHVAHIVLPNLTDSNGTALMYAAVGDREKMMRGGSEENSSKEDVW